MSRPPRRSRSKAGTNPQQSPLKSVSFTVTILRPASDLKRLASAKGLDLEEKGGDLVLTLASVTPEEALAKLGLLAGLLASKT